MDKSALIEKMDKEIGSCTACSACMNICPEEAIHMERNPEGFFEAYVDNVKCSDCGKCMTVCQLTQDDFIGKNGEPVYYAAFSKDEDNVECSSSGGIFYELSKSILKQSGVVYGAVQKRISEVMHQRGDTLEQVALFRRSKYLESYLGNCYKAVRQDLESGRKVLFSGVGCQIAGLYSFLQREYENLYTCEVVCHGIPSYLAFEKYLMEKDSQYRGAIYKINFRDKRFGWKDNAICEYFENGQEDVTYSSLHPLHSIYLKGINMRKNCGSCRYACIPRVADITLADFWQYKGGLVKVNSNRGLSLIAINNERGEQLLAKIEDFIYFDKVSKFMALKSCRHMNNSPLLSKSQPVFLKLLQHSSFYFAFAICTSFGPVIGEKKLHKMTGINEDYIWDTFWKDEQEVVYVLDEDKKPKGIVTYGSFIRNYKEKKEWVNYDFKRVALSENCIQEIQNIFDSNLKINRIPIIDEKGYLIFEVRRNAFKIIPYPSDEIFIERAKSYEKIFYNRKLVVLDKREQWKTENSTSSVFIVDTMCKKTILKQKYDQDSIYGEEYQREMEMVEPFIQLCCNEIETYFIKRPDLLSDYSYTQEEVERIKSKKSFPELSEDIKENEDLFKGIFGEKFSHAYIDGLRKIPQIVKKNERYQHIDQISDYVNVFGGCRKTIHQPQEYRKTIHMYGRCGVFGYAVEDADTIPSLLQKLFVETDQKIRVVNHGLWGADNEKILHNLSMDVAEGIIKRGDQVVIYMDYLSCMEQLEKLGLSITDSTMAFHKLKRDKPVFYDRPGHMTAEGYQYIARFIYETLKHPAIMECSRAGKLELNRFLSYFHREKYNSKETGLEKYISGIEEQIVGKIDLKKKIGAIVMNCNPFTKGHRYLIEQALREVDSLLVFVLEEDKSFFSFTDRLQMVKDGTKDLKDVYVFPSGRYMISALTFPEYFIKEQEKDIKIDPITDVEIFARDIAPRFHISIRFVGTEPNDKVTKQYNDVLIEQLPIYNIDIREIDRLEQEGCIVTATEVRKKLTQGNNKDLKKLVPQSTYDYLKKIGFIKKED